MKKTIIDTTIPPNLIKSLCFYHSSVLKKNKFLIENSSNKVVNKDDYLKLISSCLSLLWVSSAMKIRSDFAFLIPSNVFELLNNLNSQQNFSAFNSFNEKLCQDILSFFQLIQYKEGDIRRNDSIEEWIKNSNDFDFSNKIQHSDLGNLKKIDSLFTSIVLKNFNQK